MQRINVPLAQIWRNQYLWAMSRILGLTRNTRKGPPEGRTIGTFGLAPPALGRPGGAHEEGAQKLSPSPEPLARFPRLGIT